MTPIGSGWLFVLAVAGPLIGFLLALAAVSMAAYSLCARNSRRNLITRRLALGLSLLSVFVSAPLWIEMISGRYLNGATMKYDDPDLQFSKVIIALEAAALSLSVCCSVIASWRSRTKNSADNASARHGSFKD